jgi:UDP-sugar pyrophosphorylase
MPEFVNPKYTDASKSAFKAPTRLECMMQAPHT